MEEAIKKSISAGYKPSEMYLEVSAYGADYQFLAISTDPTFWQALGKSMGWKDYWYIDDLGREREVVVWKDHQHRLIDHLAEGKDIDSFFKDLLSEQTAK